MKKTLMIMLSALMLISLTACGGAGKDYLAAANSSAAPAEGGYYDYGWDEAEVTDEWVEAPEAEVEVPTPAETPNPDTAPSASINGDISQPKETSRKIIKNGSLDVETLDYDRFVSDLESEVAALGGYIESSSQYGGQSYYGSSTRSASYTVRVPSENYSAFMNKVGELATVTRTNEYIDDVTMKYIDIEARLAAYKAERDSFMELMEQAQTVDEILQIQSYLTDVNYQIESYTSQFNALKDQVSYSTVTISVSEVERVTPPEPKTVWERIGSNLSENLYDIKTGATDLFVGVVSGLPYILIFIVVVGIAAAVIVGIVKASNKKQQKRIEEYRKQNEQSGGNGTK